MSVIMSWTARRYFTSSSSYLVLLKFGTHCLNYARYLYCVGTQHHFRRCCTLYSVSKRASDCRPGILGASGNFQQGLSLSSSVKGQLLRGPPSNTVLFRKVNAFANGP